jgi:hypothetical protein
MLDCGESKGNKLTEARIITARFSVFIAMRELGKTNNSLYISKGHSDRGLREEQPNEQWSNTHPPLIVVQQKDTKRWRRGLLSIARCQPSALCRGRLSAHGSLEEQCQRARAIEERPAKSCGAGWARVRIGLQRACRPTPSTTRISSSRCVGRKTNRLLCCAREGWGVGCIDVLPPGDRAFVRCGVSCASPAKAAFVCMFAASCPNFCTKCTRITTRATYTSISCG